MPHIRYDVKYLVDLRKHFYHLFNASDANLYFFSLTLLRLGLIKINDMSANFNNLGPR